MTIQHTTLPPTHAPQSHLRSAIAAAVLLGIGSAALFDGIVLHQILQWHHMLTAVHPMNSLDNIAINALWDGLFEAGAAMASVAGCVLLWRTSQQVNLKPLRLPMIGGILWGAGSFNLIEGVIDHHLLQIHHVRSGPYQNLWDAGFLAIALLLLLLGLRLLRSPEPTGEPEPLL